MTALIHDHYDGSAYCVECGGKCQLAGDALHLTEIVRAIFEQSVYCNPPRPVFGQLRWALESAGVNIQKHSERALEAKP